MGKIGDKIIDYNEVSPVFCQQEAQILYSTDAASIVTEVNFTTTRSGLRGQVYVDSHNLPPEILEIFFVYL